MSIRTLESMLPLGGARNPQIANTIAATHDIMATFCFIAHLLVNLLLRRVVNIQREERGVAIAQIDDAGRFQTAIFGRIKFQPLLLQINPHTCRLRGSRRIAPTSHKSRYPAEVVVAFNGHTCSVIEGETTIVPDTVQRGNCLFCILNIDIDSKEVTDFDAGSTREVSINRTGELHLSRADGHIADGQVATRGDVTGRQQIQVVT